MKHIRRFLFAFLDAVLPEVESLERLRGTLARIILGFSTATGLRLKCGIDFSAAYFLITIGPDCYIGDRCCFWTRGSSIAIGSNVWIASQSVVWTGSHTIGDRRQRCGEGFDRLSRLGTAVGSA